ncbi:hypothetical protein BH11ACT4_BH11ACT4_08670 [soil metagenome]
MAQIEITTIEYTLSADYLATVGADFDVEAVDDAILARLNDIVPPGVIVHRNGTVFADEDIADEARAIDWPDLLGRVDIDQILADHAK